MNFKHKTTGSKVFKAIEQQDENKFKRPIFKRSVSSLKHLMWFNLKNALDGLFLDLNVSSAPLFNIARMYYWHNLGLSETTCKMLK